ncbi:MAG TPA: GNAT family N-acetyltransferase [Thermoanaerobaculia bacterium]|nr:GNAT family N-acetyltransferase [Thermoanaerobaculia bacterium]
MIEQLTVPVSDADIEGLALLLLDATAAGASVGFLDSITLESAEEWWRQNIANAAIVLAARDDDGITGTVQLRPASMPNQRHRADIAKLLVHRRARGTGLGRMLMAEIEGRARSAGFTLLTLDTKRGDVAESLYRRGGWTEVGVIPGYALNPDGSLCDTVIFYKEM